MLIRVNFVIKWPIKKCGEKDCKIVRWATWNVSEFFIALVNVS